MILTGKKALAMLGKGVATEGVAKWRVGGAVTRVEAVTRLEAATEGVTWGRVRGAVSRVDPATEEEMKVATEGAMAAILLHALHWTPIHQSTGTMDHTAQRK